ncbi:hypothetical protein C1Y63_05010 [Corynebacterium sp. 13CS0277]|nr:hypothetical protein C1Y63_05010 [Corynebacterium sp. 13CS0277]
MRVLLGARATAVTAVLVAGGVLAGCAAPAGTGSVVPAPVADSALDSLVVLAPEARAAEPYHRDAFGQRWSDDVRVEMGHNGCDTRNDILRRDLDNLSVKPGTHDCVAWSGDLRDPYTGEELHFQRGEGGTASSVHIDHVVALANAWATGADAWDEDLRRDFANDPANLLATSQVANKAKGAKDASQWLPPNEEFQCDYARRQVAVKAQYGLGVTPEEKQALATVLGRCGDDETGR